MSPDKLLSRLVWIFPLFCRPVTLSQLSHAASQIAANASIPQLQHLSAIRTYKAELAEYSADRGIRQRRQENSDRESLLRDHIRMLQRFAVFVSDNDSVAKAIIERKLFANASAGCPRKLAVFTGGGSASGKSSIIRFWRPIMEASPCGFVLIDSDAIMMELPEWSHIARQGDKCVNHYFYRLASDWSDEFFAKALTAGLNVVLDGTMANDAKTLEQANQLTEKGYDSHVIGVTVEVATAAEKAWERGRRNNRYVPLCAILMTHVKFSANFEKYLAFFEHVTLYDRNDKKNTYPIYQNKTILDKPAYTRFLAKANLTDDQLQKQLSPLTAQAYAELNRNCSTCRSPDGQEPVTVKGILGANHATRCLSSGSSWHFVANVVFARLWFFFYG